MTNTINSRLIRITSGSNVWGWIWDHVRLTFAFCIHHVCITPLLQQLHWLEHWRRSSSSLLFLCTGVCTGQHHRISPMSSSARLILRPLDAFTPLPHCHWLSVVHSCLLSVIGPSLLLLPILSHHVTSTPSVSVVRGRLNAFLFRRFFLWLLQQRL